MKLKNKTKPESNQDAFNRFFQHFAVEKNPRSVVDGHKCRYRIFGEGPEFAVKCACGIGIMLPDELYDPAYDRDGGLTVDAVLKEDNRIVEWFSKCGDSLLRQLQALHDGTGVGYLHNPESYVYKEFATTYDLTIPTL